MGVVYKYCKPRDVDILEKMELKITPPNQFNDPFEFTPHIVFSSPLQYAKRQLRKKPLVKDLYQMLIKEGRFSGSFRQFRDQVRSKRQQMIPEFASAAILGAASAQKVQLDHISAKFGVLCLSETRGSILMWGHYCESHKGFVIGFDALSKVFQGKNGLSPVVYSKSRVVFNANWREGSAPFERYEGQLILCKNEDWRYEKEQRQFFTLSSLRPGPLRDGTPGYFLPVPPEAVVSVTLGTRCSEEIEKKVRLALANQNLRHVRLERAVLHESEFALRFEKDSSRCL